MISPTHACFFPFFFFFPYKTHVKKGETKFGLLKLFKMAAKLHTFNNICCAVAFPAASKQKKKQQQQQQQKRKLI